jgi:hypothetical protein
MVAANGAALTESRPGHGSGLSWGGPSWTDEHNTSRLRFRTPTSRFLGRARLVFTLAALVPTILMSALGLVLLAAGPSPSVAAVASTLVTCHVVGGALALPDPGRPVEGSDDDARATRRTNCGDRACTDRGNQGNFPDGWHPEFGRDFRRCKIL